MIDLPLKIDYSGKVVVVTGAGGLICGAMARAFAQSGAKVAALDLNEDAVKKLADELTSEGFICNVIKPMFLSLTRLRQFTNLFSPISDLAIYSSTAPAVIIREQRRTMNISTKQKRAENPSLIWIRPELISYSSSISKEHFCQPRCLRRIWSKKSREIYLTFLR